jgi:hypothetical protein
VAQDICQDLSRIPRCDGVPTPETLNRRKERILEYWQLERRRHPAAFEQEARYDLVGFDDKPFVAESSLEYLSAHCDFLIEERGYDRRDKN